MSRSYVVVRDGREVRLKRCDDCGEVKLCTADRHSEFYVAWGNSRTRPSWSRFCKVCLRRQRREIKAAMTLEERRAIRQATAERIRNDPERLALQRWRYMRWQRQRMATDPEYRERRRLASRRYYRRLIAVQPDYFSQANREARRLARETAQTPIRESRVLLPRAPMLEALERFAAERKGDEASPWWILAGLSGVPERSIARIRSGESRRVRLDVADKLAIGMDVPLELIYGIAAAA